MNLRRGTDVGQMSMGSGKSSSPCKPRAACDDGAPWWCAWVQPWVAALQALPHPLGGSRTKDAASSRGNFLPWERKTCTSAGADAALHTVRYKGGTRSRSDTGRERKMWLWSDAEEYETDLFGCEDGRTAAQLWGSDIAPAKTFFVEKLWMQHFRPSPLGHKTH